MRKHFVRTATKYPDIFPDTSFSMSRPLSDEQVAILSGKQKPTRAPRRARAKDSLTTQKVEAQLVHVNQPEPGDTPEAGTPPARQNIDWRRLGIDTLAVSVVIGHAGLLWYDCAAIWALPGQIAGGLVFAVVLLAVLLASDATLPRSSAAAMWFIGIVDFAAYFVHFEVFRTPVVPNVYTGAFCAFICACSFMALYLYRDSKIY